LRDADERPGVSAAASLRRIIMNRMALSSGVLGALALLLASTATSAGIISTIRGPLDAAATLSLIDKAHETHGGMHQYCRRHKPPGAYPDCHWHYRNPHTGKWEVRRRKLDGTPCPLNQNCEWL
jgi:hypothetical protein